ncbi:hypothetical protein EKO04_004496 [Ascochyta lentis]|uniref:Uncharacterized protein n=1 Tax=Ascochyta lentis TaxID=205686 RepID=A0A8H7MK64_9PLEO|nr:hypothetical protein EKO04_004496 [Ascochyta lentis]
MDGVFNPANPQLANCYERWGRCLAIMDLNIYNVYGKDMQAYFDHFNMNVHGSTQQGRLFFLSLPTVDPCKRRSKPKAHIEHSDAMRNLPRF